MKKLILVMAVPLILGACQAIQDKEPKARDITNILGQWLFTLQIDGQIIPFNTTFSSSNGELIMHVRNGEESILVEDINIVRDSIFIQMPFFNSHFFGKLSSDSLIVGFWVDESRPDNYNIPFTGYQSKGTRFKYNNDSELADFGGSWKIAFDPDAEESCQGIGIFTQNGNEIEGTILTEAGDHRYLQGNVDGNIISLSSFDGAHAFLYNGKIDEDGSIQGTFWSGNHLTEPWVGERDDNFTLIHPDSLTYVKNETSIGSLSFNDFNNKSVSLGDEAFNNKVLIVQIMGTWCPNCLDESVLFEELYSTYHDKGLEIVAVVYERGDDMDIIKKRIERYKNQIGIEYDFLYGGTASKPLAAEHFSMLNEITSFPTAIILDRSGNVRKIHTGFYGPGTGDHYVKFKSEITNFLEGLLNESLAFNN